MGLFYEENQMLANQILKKWRWNTMQRTKLEQSIASELTVNFKLIPQDHNSQQHVKSCTYVED